MSTPSRTQSLLQRWETVRRTLPAVNPVLKGHPLHAMLTDLPVALIPTGFLFSFAGRLGKQPVLEGAGYANTVAGLAAAVPTVLTGLADYLQMEVTDLAQKTGFTHALLNLLGLSLAIGSLGGRSLRRPGSSRALWLSGLSAGTLLVSAYLGGDLVYHRGWRVKPIEREEIEQHKVPETIHDDDFLLRPARGVSVTTTG